MEQTATENADTRESNKIDEVVSSLWERDLITDIECRMIGSCNELMEKKAAVYTVIMSRSKEEAVELTEAIKSLTETTNIQPDENTTSTKIVDCKADDINVSLVKPNPFLNNTVITCLFGFLSLDEIKGSRCVCRQWNSTAEIYLRKRAAICFSGNGLQLRTFMKVSKYSLPNRPFSAYKFSDMDFSPVALESFCEKFGKKIKEVTFQNVKLITIYRSTSKYDITPWIDKMSNLSSLKVKLPTPTAFEISIEKLLPLKTVSLASCHVLIKSELYTRLAPSAVNLDNIVFNKQGSFVKNCRYNDFFDFSVAKYIHVKDRSVSGWSATFDMEGIQFNADHLSLSLLRIQNWDKAEGCVDFVKLVKCQFLRKKNQLTIRRFEIESSPLDFSVLPQTVETLTLGKKLYVDFTDPIQLINLKHITLHIENNTSEMLTYFKDCPSLTELEIIGESGNHPPTLYLGFIPKSVQKMSINSSSNLKFVKSNSMLELDTLILIDPPVDIGLTYSRLAPLKNIKPKNLVIRYEKCRLIHASHIRKIILENNHIKNIAIGMLDGDAKKIRFEEIPLSEGVDKNSGCYIFENQVGRAITRKEFTNMIKMHNVVVVPFDL